MRRLKTIIKELVRNHRQLVFLDTLLEKDGALNDTEKLDDYEGIFTLLDDGEQREQDLLAELCEAVDAQSKDITE